MLLAQHVEILGSKALFAKAERVLVHCRMGGRSSACTQFPIPPLHPVGYLKPGSQYDAMPCITSNNTYACPMRQDRKYFYFDARRNARVVLCHIVN